MTLFETIHSYYNEHENLWNYYRRPITDPFGDFFISDFIRDYFDFGGKSMVVSSLCNEMEPMRHSHTMSVFFLGLVLKQQISPNLEVASIIDHESFEFSYMWFMVCLFHDMGYVQEKDWKYKFKYRQDAKKFTAELKTEFHKYKRELHREDFNELYGDFQRNFQRRFEYDDLGVIFCAPQIFGNRFSSCRRESNNDGIRFNNGTIVRKSRYRKNTILNYLEYCKMYEEINHYDHGIVGGFWLYDSLLKNHYKQFIREISRGKSFINIENFKNSENLLFSKKQWKIFAYLADCVISHNMWPANNETNERYRECELNELSLDQFEVISFSENPILYLLAISDTIEPIKVYSDLGLTDKEILTGVVVVINAENISMKIIDSRMPFERLVNKIRGIELWLDVRTDVDYSDKKLHVYF